MQKIGDHFCCFLSCHLGSCFNVNVEFPMWVNSKSAVKGIIKILKHIKQVVLLRFAKVGKLFDNIVHVQLFILCIQVGRGKAVWIVPVSAKGLFLLAVYFKGFDHSEIGSHMGNLRLNHSMVPEHYFMLMPLFVRKSALHLRSDLISPSNTSVLCCSMTHSCLVLAIVLHAEPPSDCRCTIRPAC